MAVNSKTAIRRVLYINTLTLFGSFLSFVPVSTFLSKTFGLGAGFAIILILTRLPSFLFPHAYIRMAVAHGAVNVITWSQLLAGLMSIVVVYSISANLLPLMIVGLIVLYCLSSSLSVLFPAIIKKVSDQDGLATRPFAHWQMARHIALLLAMAIGGYCANKIDVRVFVLVDTLTFFAAFLSWNRNSAQLTRYVESIETTARYLSLKQYFFPLNVANVLKKFVYGVFNPILPVILLDNFKRSTATLGDLYFLLGLSALVGASVAGRLPLAFTVLVAGFTFEIGLIAVSLVVKSVWLFFVCTCLGALIMGVIDVHVQTLIMRTAKDGFAARKSAIFESSLNGALLVGYGVFGLMAKHVQMVEWIYIFFASAVLMLIMLIVARGRREI